MVCSHSIAHGSKGQRKGIKGVRVKVIDTATEKSRSFSVHGWTAKEVYEIIFSRFQRLCALDK